MDQETIDTLKKHNLDGLVDRFKDEEIDFRVLLELTPEMIKRLCPNIGTQSRLLKMINELKVNGQESTHNKDVVSRTTSNASTVILSQELSNSSNVSEEEPDENSSKLKRMRYSSVSLDVRAILKSDVRGQEILKKYEIEKKLNDSSRSLITRKVIDQALTKSIDLSENDYLSIFIDIENVFPTEIIETYFVPCKGKSKHSSGRLPNYYRNIRSRLGLKERANRSTENVNNLEDELHAAGNLNEEGTEDEITEALESLKDSASLNKKELIRLWKITFPRRQRKLKAENPLSVVLQEWCAYKTPSGIDLVEEDFKLAFPGKEDALLNIWPNFCTKLVNYMSATLRDDTSVLLLENLSTLQDNSRNLMILKLLPKVLKPTNRRSGGSTANARESFLLHIESSCNIDEEINRKKEEAFKKKCPIQPFLIVAGPANDARNVVIVVEDFYWSATSVLDGFNKLFKTFMVLNLKYPAPCHNIMQLCNRFYLKLRQKP